MALIMGISLKDFKSSNFSSYELCVARPMQNFENDKIRIRSTGFTTEVPKGKDPLKIEKKYAEMLLESGAFVPNKDYELTRSEDPDDPLQTIITELKPVDKDVKKYFEDTLSDYLAKP